MIAKAISRILPENRIKDKLRRLYYTYRQDSRIYGKIAFLPILDSGLSEEGTPFVKLNNGLTFYGHLPDKNQEYLYNCADEKIKEKVTESAFGVAQDIIYRYLDAYEHGRGHNKEKYYNIKNGDTVLDVGAYTGFWTLKAAKIVGEDGHVIAIEAERENLKLLEKNIQANSLKNVTIVPKGVWKEEGKQTLYLTDRQANTLIEGGGGIIQPKRTMSIEVDTLDNILRDLGIVNVDFISIEINGAEIEALEGMRETLDQDVISNLVIAAPYHRFGQPSYKIVASALQNKGLSTLVDNGKVYASKVSKR